MKNCDFEILLKAKRIRITSDQFFHYFIIIQQFPSYKDIQKALSHPPVTAYPLGHRERRRAGPIS